MESIKEKAQRYDEALERARIWKDKSGMPKDRQGILDDIFPELKESEDEKMLREIKRYIKEQGNKPTGLPNGTAAVADMLAWLEKQGEHKPQGKSALEAIKEEKVDNRNYIKPADKAEPKFHEGEWLCENKPNNYARFIQILETVNVQGKERYRISRDIHNDEDIVEVDFVEKYYHKFDIKDAKAGDVLADGNLPFIFKKTDTNKYSYAYCGISVDDGFKIESDGESGEWTWMQDIKPATKEQRNTLFVKMKEAGYEWDGDKKELKKIEQKPAWSEEDEKMLSTVIEDIVKLAGPYVCYRTDVEWLKSLKGRVQPKQDWSQNDIDMIDWLIRCCEKEHEELCNDKYGHQDIVSDLKRDCRKKWDWLESLKNRVAPQKQWKPSEEQMKALKDACDEHWEPDGLDPLYTLYEQLKQL